ncbi:MAG: nucleotidyltransferase domain-containing protein [Muribaculaceae bacterium]|nr:nucleotidyltransferase domain-containing protein [Muribaculaceae bacterium]
MQLITDNIQKIIALCRKYGVKSLYVFGSILTNRFNENSDVDFSAIFHPEENPLIAGENRIQFYIGLQELMGRRIDLVDEEYIRNPYFKEELEETKQLIYG